MYLKNISKTDFEEISLLGSPALKKCKRSKLAKKQFKKVLIQKIKGDGYQHFT